MTPNCKWYRRSKTLWFNAIAAALATLEATTGVIQPYIPVNVYLILAVAVPIINSFLRAITTQALTLKADP